MMPGALSTQSWTDAGGESHALSAAPRRRRIVSLVPSLTETLCEVGGRERLVGCTAFCIRPEGLLKSPDVVKIGGTKTVLREKLLALKPDLILANLEENTLDDIAFFRTRVECYLNGTKTLVDGIQSIREVGALIGAETSAEALAQRAEAELTRIRAAVAASLSGLSPTPNPSPPTPSVRPRVFYAIWRDPWMTINGDTFISNMLAECGAVNVFAEHAGSRYPVVTWEEISAACPDRIWLPSEPYRFKAKHIEEIRKLPGLPAALTQRIELVDGDSACWFGTRQIEGMAITHRQLWSAP